MPGINISRAEALERSSHLTVASYDVTIDVTNGEATFIAKTIVKFACNKPGYDTFVDAVGKRIISATLNGHAVDVSNFDGESVFLKNLAASNELVLEIEAIYSKSGEGLQRSVDPVDNEVYLYSQGETAFIRHMFPCFDQPDLKGTFTLTAIAPSHWEVISNNTEKSKTDLGNKKSKWEFETTPVLPTYLCALIAGPYAHIHDTYVGKKTIPLGIYCRKSLFEFLDAEDVFLITKQGFAYFENVFGLAYPFAKYDQIAVVDFNWGAMENAGAVTFREDLLVFRSKVTERMYSARANTILHEMAHMWFGDMVTMKWWDDLWLNESFAEWSSYLALVEATRFKNAWAGFNTERKNWAYRQDQLTSTHPIATDMIDIDTVKANFDGISYAKGASALHQLVAHVGRENFISGLQKYFAKHAFKNTTLDDLLNELTATSGRNLKPWVDTWLKTSGVNTLRPKLEISGDTYASVSVIQEAPTMPVGSTELRPHRMAVGLYDLSGSNLKLRKSVELDVAGALTEIKELAGEKVADLLLLNDRDLSYGKIRFDDRSIATLKFHLGKLDDGLARALCWSAAWDMLRDAEISATDFVEIAIAGMPGESDITIVTMLIAQLSTAVELYASKKNQDALRELIAATLIGLLDAATPESDHQLQFAKGFAALAHTPAQGARIREVLDGKLTGLKVDTDLRWLLLTALVERDLATRADVDAELLRDNTLTGQLSHEVAIAAFPDASTKALAWKRAVEDDLTSWTRVSIIRGFSRPMHRALQVPYVDKYFELLLDTWANKSYEESTTIIDGLFPMYVTNQSTLDKANHWLDITGKDGHASLRRHVAEARDSLQRALKVQAKDK